MKEFFDQCSALIGYLGHYPHHILRAVPETDPPSAKAKLVERQIARPLLGDVALPRIVDIQHAVHVGIGRLYLHLGQVGIPEAGQVIQCLIHLSLIPEGPYLGQSRLDALLLAQLGYQAPCLTWL